MLEKFLADLARADFAWGENDCAMTVANWWLLKRGIDPAADLRGTYGTEQECMAVVAREGGVLAVVERCAVRAGARSVTEPLPGDIGVISVHGQEFGAVMGSRGRWMVKSAHGLAGYRCDAIMAWRS